MGKLERFKARAAAHGQSVTLYPFLANPSGTYVNAASGYPDPESATYPATVPTVTYNTAVTVTGFMQTRRSDVFGGESYQKITHGEDIDYDLLFYAPGDQAVTTRDKVSWDGAEHTVQRTVDFMDGAVVVMRTWYLKKKVA